MTDFLTVDDVSNKPDRNGLGCVPYVYSIGRVAVSNEDWCEFLNDIGLDKSLCEKLWHKDMTIGILGGIDKTHDGFVAKLGWEKKPVVYVNYLSLIKYCNWLQSGDIAKGAYDLTETPPRRMEGARYFLPTEDEWYKAAYWDGTRYWKYPNKSDDPPTLEEVNYERGDEFSVGGPYYLADVDAFADSPSPWGALQMGGNAWEMLEDCFQNPIGNKLRGGSFGYTETGLSADNTDYGKFNGRCYVFGARLAFIDGGWTFAHKPFKYRFLSSIKMLINKCKKFVKKLILH